jgi:hypothetical protein
MAVFSLSLGSLPKVPFVVVSHHQISFSGNCTDPSVIAFGPVPISNHLKPIFFFSPNMTWQGHIKDGSAPLMNTESLKRRFQSPHNLHSTHEHFMGLTRQKHIFAQGLHQCHEAMQSANGTDYRPIKSSRQSCRSPQSRGHHPFNASGTSLHDQWNMHNVISDDFSVGFPDDFHMVR